MSYNENVSKFMSLIGPFYEIVTSEEIDQLSEKSILTIFLNLLSYYISFICLFWKEKFIYKLHFLCVFNYSLYTCATMYIIIKYIYIYRGRN